MLMPLPAEPAARAVQVMRSVPAAPVSSVAATARRSLSVTEDFTAVRLFRSVGSARWAIRLT